MIVDDFSGRLIADGAVVFPQVLRATEICLLKSSFKSRVVEKFRPDGAAYTLPINLDEHAGLIRHGIAISHSMSFRDIRYLAGAVIPKYGGEPERPWHVDWNDWDAPETQFALPTQIGIIFYLDDASIDKGSLEIRAGSHHQRPVVETKLLQARPGDAIVIDARTDHRVTASKMPPEHARVAITLWYLVNWANLSEQVRSTAMLSMSKEIIATLGANNCPDYYGDLPPKAPNPVRKGRIYCANTGE